MDKICPKCGKPEMVVYLTYVTNKYGADFTRLYETN